MFQALDTHDRVCRGPRTRAEELERENLRVLRKPYRQADLVAALREVLSDTAS